MANPNKLFQFKVLYFLIGYLAASFAIIEFVLNASETFSLPEKTIRLLYLLSAIGIPVVILLPWFINRRNKEEIEERHDHRDEPHIEEEIKSLHNLPAQLTSFIGRKKEMQVVKELIAEHRLVMLTGAGGCGKTRLACEVAAQLVQDFEDGVWFVDLAPISNEGQVAREILEALTISEVSDQPIIDTLIKTIKGQKLLIILDNCEHLIKTCAIISGQLIQSTAYLKILATSRESLGIAGERVWRIPSLTLIDPKVIIDLESVKQSEAVMLFDDRSRLNNPEFELELENVNEVVTICNKVDGIPLALELVASRTRHMDPKMILERFADRFEKLTSSDPRTSKRQQTLQATIEWSYNLLSEREKLLFARLSAFSGGFNLAAAEEVCSDNQLPKEIILDTLSILVDRSMVYTLKAVDQSMRYNCLETLRQFAQKITREKQEEEMLKKRHLHYFLNLAEQAYQDRYEAQLVWLKIMEADDDNLIAALDWSEEYSPKEFSLLTGTLSWYWEIKTKLILGTAYMEKALAKSSTKSGARAKVLHGLAYLSWHAGDLETHIGYCKESLGIWREEKNLLEEANCLATLARLYHNEKYDFETGLGYAEEALEIAKKIGKPGFANFCLSSICTSLVHSTQFDRGLPYVEELLESSEKLEQPQGILYARHLHSDCALGVNDFKEAEQRYALGIETGVKYGNEWMAFVDMQGVAFALSGQSRLKKSLKLNSAAMEKANSLGVNIAGVVKFWDDWIETYIEGVKKEVGEELAKQYEEEGIAMGFEKAVEYALDLEKD
jgi:non-specific serine/threonine protein kinase